VWGLAAGQTVSWGVLYYAFSVLLVPMQQDLGWSRTVLVGGFTVAVVISGLLAPAVGRRLDHGSPRLVMGAGSVAGVLLILAWARAGTIGMYYAVWTGLGVAMALVLYEPAFAVIAKRYAPGHHRALTTVTLVAGTASFIFQPLTSALATAHGWRTALVVLAAILAAVTIPLHLRLVPRRATQRRADADAGRRPSLPHVDARFWLLAAAFAGASVTSFGTSVLLVAYLVDHGWALGAAAAAAGTLGIMQLPGRLLLAPLRARLEPRVLTRLMLGVPGLGVVLLLLSGGSALVWVAVAVLGMSQGLNTLLRITRLVDLYGTARIGALTGLSATLTVLARALAPLAAAFLAGTTGGYAVPFLLLAGIAGVAAVLGGRRADPAARPPGSVPTN
jgi:MFS family permease